MFVGQAVDPAPYYTAMDTFAMSSATEQMPNALLEAMACGLPAICTDVGDCREMLAAAGSPAIIPPDDPAQYSAALATMAERADLRAVLGRANRARCVEHYPFDLMVRRHAALYE